ncbi:unnamed protein product [Musa textilis]
MVTVQVKAFVPCFLNRTGPPGRARRRPGGRRLRQGPRPPDQGPDRRPRLRRLVLRLRRRPFRHPRPPVCRRRRRRKHGVGAGATAGEVYYGLCVVLHYKIRLVHDHPKSQCSASAEPSNMVPRRSWLNPTS